LPASDLPEAPAGEITSPRKERKTNRTAAFEMDDLNIAKPPSP
jgi:hypothetical protein